MSVLTEREAKIWQQGDEYHIDVRGLAPPQPMVEVIRLLEMEQVKDTVIMHHDREPIYLFPELLERNWTYKVQQNGDEFIIRLTREKE